MSADAAYEQAQLAQGHRAIAGIDEAGRGCWAGPVVAAAVIFPPTLLRNPARLRGLNDSKQLSMAAREHWFAQIIMLAEAIGVGVVHAYQIDAFGIVPATRLAMTTALLSLATPPDALLIDAVPLPDLRLAQLALIGGDRLSLSIAAASVIAKVRRDQLMTSYDSQYPAYHFASHKGYGTAAHHAALAAHGPCPLHRRTFRPLLAY